MCSLTGLWSFPPNVSLRNSLRVIARTRFCTVGRSPIMHPTETGVTPVLCTEQWTDNKHLAIVVATTTHFMLDTWCPPNISHMQQLDTWSQVTSATHRLGVKISILVPDEMVCQLQISQDCRKMKAGPTKLQCEYKQVKCLGTANPIGNTKKGYMNTETHTDVSE